MKKNYKTKKNSSTSSYSSTSMIPNKNMTKWLSSCEILNKHMMKWSGSWKVPKIPIINISGSSMKIMEPMLCSSKRNCKIPGLTTIQGYKPPRATTKIGCKSSSRITRGSMAIYKLPNKYTIKTLICSGTLLNNMINNMRISWKSSNKIS